MFEHRRAMCGLVVTFLMLVSGISSKKHALHKQHLKVEHSAKKFNILAHPSEDSLVVVMKGRDGVAGQNGSQGGAGVPGRPGPPGPAGLQGAPGFCTKEQCESNELKLLIQRVITIEKYVKEKQNKNQVGSQPPGQAVPSQQGTNVSAQQPTKVVAPAVPVTGQAQPGPAPSAPAGPSQRPITPAQQPPNPVSPAAPVPGQGQPAPAPSAPAGPSQGPITPAQQPPNPVSPAAPVPGQGQPAPAPSAPPQGPSPPQFPARAIPAPGQGQPATPILPQMGNKPLPQPSKAVTPPVSSPVTAPVQGQPALAPGVPAGSPQVLWGTLTASPGPASFSSPVGVTVQSTLEAPGTFLRGNGQIDIQGVVTPQVSVQGFTGDPGTSLQPGSTLKKNSIPSHGTVTKNKHAQKKSSHHTTVRTHKS